MSRASSASDADAERLVTRQSIQPSAVGQPPVVSAGASFDGLLIFRGEASVEGEFRGRVEAHGKLVIARSGDVRADIAVDELVVEGKLEGRVEARERVVLGANASVRGELSAPRFVLSDGCRLDGRCTTAEAPVPVPARTPNP